MSTSSFWKIPDVSNMKTPLSIMREQIEELSKVTNGLLSGKLNSHQASSTTIILSMYIVVPAMNNYTVKVVEYMQPITLYPGRLDDELSGVSFIIDDESSFLSNLRDILGSEHVTKVIASLMSQVLNSA